MRQHDAAARRGAARGAAAPPPAWRLWRARRFGCRSGSARPGPTRFLRTSTCTVLERPCGKLCRTEPVSIGLRSLDLAARAAAQAQGALVVACYPPCSSPIPQICASHPSPRGNRQAAPPPPRNFFASPPRDSAACTAMLAGEGRGPVRRDVSASTTGRPGASALELAAPVRRRRPPPRPAPRPRPCRAPPRPWRSP